jgi:single-strand DNA-binding protein
MLQGFAVGRIGKDADLRSVNGTAVSNFSLAVEVGYGERKKTLWLDCALWGKQAESLTKYLTKGKTIAVLGSLDVSAWVSHQDGEPRGSIQVIVSEVTLCGVAPPATDGDSKTSHSAKAAISHSAKAG